ncbi:MAG: elongation factor G [Nannocystales bacterium]
MTFKTLRNLGILAHVDAGKTTLAERLLFFTGRIHRITEVRDKDGGGATMDARADEQRRGITIKSAATRMQWGMYGLNLIDTPGHVDFTIEVERSLRVLDGAVLVLCGVAGVQAQTGTVVRQMERHGVPCIAFINKLDLTGADPHRVSGQLRKLGHNAALLTLPIGLERELRGVVDLVEGRALRFGGDHGQDVVESEIPEGMRDVARAARLRLIEAVAEVDDDLLSQYVDGRTLDVQTIKDAIRRATVARRFTPVLCGSARANVGVQPLLDAVVAYLPHPGDVSTEAFGENDTPVILDAEREGPLRALAFKTIEDSFGSLTMLRVYQGRLERGQTVITEGRKHRVGRLVRVHADTMTDIDAAEAGDIVATFGASFGTAEVLTSDGASISMRPMTIPQPVMAYAIVPKDETMLEKLAKVLGRLCREDPTLRVRQDPQTGETLLAGMGELHLEIYCDQLRDEHGIELYRSAPQVGYRETLREPVSFNYLHKKQDGGSGQFARVVGTVRPLENGYCFVDRIKGGVIPREFISACDAGARDAVHRGPLLGAEVHGVEVTLEDGKTHEKDSSELAFRIAARDAITDALRRADMVVLEPLMRVEVDAPVAFVGAVQSGLVRRRGQVQDCQVGEHSARIIALVPLAELFGYATGLRSATEGKGEHTMELAHYAATPTHVQTKLVAADRR